jgi:hypothetical protein
MIYILNIIYYIYYILYILYIWRGCVSIQFGTWFQKWTCLYAPIYIAMAWAVLYHVVPSMPKQNNLYYKNNVHGYERKHNTSSDCFHISSFMPIKCSVQLISVNPLTSKIAKPFYIFSRWHSMQGTFLNIYRYRSIKQVNPICVKKTGLSHIINIYWVPDHYMVSFPLALPECRGLGCAEGSRNGDPKATNQPWENMKSLRDF